MCSNLNSVFWTVQEDICLGEALLERKVFFAGCDNFPFSEFIADVHKIFVRKTARFGIKGHRRSEKALINRVKRLSSFYRSGHLDFDETCENSLEPQRYLLFSSIFEGAGPAPNRQPGLVERARALHKTKSHYQNSSSSRASKQANERRTRNARIHLVKKEYPTRVLQTFTRIQKQRANVAIKREMNMKKQQEVDLLARKWRVSVFELLMRGECSRKRLEELLVIFENLLSNDTKLHMVREDKLGEQIEEERELREWEQSTFEELMKRHFD